MAKAKKRPEAAPEANPGTPTPEAQTPQQVTTPSANGGGRKPPAFEFRCGRVRVVCWENFSEAHGRWYSVNLTRSYKDEKSGDWKQATSLGRDDLLAGAECLRQAYHWINEQLGGGAHTPKPQQPAETNGNVTTTPNGSTDDPIAF